MPTVKIRHTKQDHPFDEGYAKYVKQERTAFSHVISDKFRQKIWLRIKTANHPLRTVFFRLRDWWAGVPDPLRVIIGICSVIILALLILLKAIYL